MRGKAKAHLITRLALGITPAHAGKSQSPPYNAPCTGDHPRACGEKGGAVSFASPVPGSPPRMRGKDITGAGLIGSKRITPAHAGKRQRWASATDGSWDHPRACGEKYREKSDRLLKRGSPPRMRGKGHAVVSLAHIAGITPAHAGKSTRWSRSCRRWWDHPRACGEKRSLLNMGFDGKGSPPRMRGKGFPFVNRVLAVGITPAHAGKSGLHDLSKYNNEDHPRACGEKTAAAVIHMRSQGSPPRMRGKATNGIGPT